MNIFEPKPYPSISQSIGITFIVIFGMFLFAPLLFLGDLIGPDTALFIYYVFAVGVPFWVVYSIRNKNSEKIVFNVEVGGTKIVLLILLATIAIQNAITVPIMELIPMPDSIKELFNNLFGNPRNIFSILTIVVAAPIFEELIFRGIILDGLLKRYSPVKAIIVSSALFGLVHLNPWQFVGAFVLGIFIGWVYHKTKSITLAIAIHAFNNLTASLFMYFDTEKELVDKSMIDLLGGGLNFTIYVIAFFGLLAATLYLLNKEFKNSNQFISKEKEIDD